MIEYECCPSQEHLQILLRAWAEVLTPKTTQITAPFFQESGLFQFIEFVPRQAEPTCFRCGVQSKSQGVMCVDIKTEDKALRISKENNRITLLSYLRDVSCSLGRSRPSVKAGDKDRYLGWQHEVPLTFVMDLRYAPWMLNHLPSALAWWSCVTFFAKKKKKKHCIQRW